MGTVLLHVIGNLGVLMILGAYFLVSTGRLASISPKYQYLNLAGGSIMVVYSIILVAWASVVLNGVWAIIAATSLVRNARRRKSEAPA